MVKVENLTIKYDGFLAVSNISFDVPKGAILAMLGVNGSGKTSILKAISGINQNYSGDIYINGENINTLTVEQRVKKKITLVPEGREIFSNLTVRENLFVGGHTIKKDLNKKIDEIFEQFPMIKKFENKLAGKLSGGQQQLVAIARAVMVSPNLLLVDEPTMGLTPKNSTLVLEYLKSLKKKGMTVIVSSSTFKLNNTKFDLELVIQNGKIKNKC